MGVKLRFTDEDDENVGVESGRAVADVSRETARQVQKQLVKKGYAAKKRAENTQKAAETAKRAGEAGRNVLEKTLSFVREHAGSIVLAAIFGGFFIMFTGGLSSCSMAMVAPEMCCWPPAIRRRMRISGEPMRIIKNWRRIFRKRSILWRLPIRVMMNTGISWTKSITIPMC